MKTQFISSALLTLFLSGCAMHMSQQECANTNWNQLGFNDGTRGAAHRDLDQDVSDCAKFKINVNAKAYEDGYQSGLARYCSYNKGRSLGNSGSQKSSVCNNGSFPSFQRGYKDGIRQYCTYQRGVSIGATGKANPGVCHGGSFNQGFNKGIAEFCRHSNNGYSLGRTGKAYPAGCSQDRFPAFYESYQRGQTIHGRTAEIQSQIQPMTDKINELVEEHHYHLNADGSYRLGSHHHSDSAEAHLNEVNELIKDREHLKNKLFKTQTGRYWD